MGTYLSWHLGWLLLAPEPREEQRGIGGAAVPFGMGALFLAISLFLSRQD